MCGIAGYLNLDGRPADEAVLTRMIRTLDHRGPDGTGNYLRGPLGLAHDRLSIIDVTGGTQPMADDDDSLWITFNGEIFNYVELREELILKGYRFHSRSDTEVILKLYREYGPDCVQKMNGQWAFAIWDAARRRLFLSRDRVGVRPLFYVSNRNAFIFASEIKALRAHPNVDPEIDFEALRQVFTYWFPLSPRSFFKGVSELPAGHSMIIEDGRIDVRPYWNLDFSLSDAMANDDQAEQPLVDELHELLFDATRIRLRADVPVGAYVSGGLDSSITAALAQQVVGDSLHTFSLSFEDPSLDESGYQAEVVKRLGTKHQTCHCSAADIARIFPEVIRHTETPILRTAPAPMFLLSELVHESGFKVVLTGEGADEFMGGYDIFKEAKIRAFCAAHMDSKFRPLLLKRLYPYLEGIQKQPIAYLRAFFHVSPGEVANPYFSHVPRWGLTARTQALFSVSVRSEFEDRARYSDMDALMPEGFSNWKPFSRSQYLEAAFLLPNYLLSSQGDRMAMANAVEGRYPFLDYRVIEFCEKLPARLKMKVLNEKYLLKKTFGNVVPDSVKQRTKQPYRAPDAVSFFEPATGKAREAYVEELLSMEAIRANDIFDPGAVGKLVEKARAGKAVSFVDNAALVGVLSTQMVVNQAISNRREAVLHGSN